MDTAVALIEAYLHINGYFTVAEYPVLESLRRGGTRTATDLDILAFRFPEAGCKVERGGRRVGGPVVFQPDSALGVPAHTADMIVGEVKEGPAHFNPPARDPLVLETALARFGCCPSDTAAAVVKRLLRKGQADTPSGHAVRLIAFGSAPGGDDLAAKVITLGHVIDFLRQHLRRHWNQLGPAQLSQPALAFLALMEKAEKSERT
ncbi:MAG TPA: hypothetical protein VLV83_17765 [Acidobacteriota bacterium]|nr:hypothetical protein [Acidobacteriota bacterium]